MTFYINQCSLQFNMDPNLELFRKIIFSVIVFEIVFVMVLRIVSGFKNYDLHMIRKQLEEKKIIEDKAILQTIQGLNNLTQDNQTIMTLMSKSQNTIQNLKVIKKNPINGNGIDRTILQNGFGESNQTKEMQIEKPQNISEESDSSDESETTQQNDQDEKQPSADQAYDNELILEESMNFINVFNIKLSRAQASNFFNIVLGHFFISAALSIPHSPSIYSSAFAGLHGMLFVLLIVINACVSDKKNKVANQMERENKNQSLQHQRNLSSNLMVEGSKQMVDSQVEKSPEPSEKPLKRRLSLLIMVLMCFISLSLLALSVTQIKQSYFITKQNRCQ